MANTKTYRAIVENVVRNGKHGPYVVAKSEDLVDSVTFALNKNVWSERHEPEPGQYVILQDIVSKRAGWRAKKARAENPNDDVAQSTEQRRK